MAVYFPQSINFAGQLLLVPNSRVQRIEIEPSRLFPFLVSGGITGVNISSDPESASTERATWMLPAGKSGTTGG